MPGVQELCETHNSESRDSSDQSSSHAAELTPPHTSVPEQPKSIRLWLPSSVPPSLSTAGCSPGLAEKERKLQLAQADDALVELRWQLRISATLLDYKKLNIGGTSQRMGTHARTLMSQFCDKTYHCAECYDAAYNALLLLDPDGDWKQCLQSLVQSRDLRLPRHDKDDDPSEGRRELSWIWLAARSGSQPTAVASEDEVNDGKSLILLCLSGCSVRKF